MLLYDGRLWGNGFWEIRRWKCFHLPFKLFLDTFCHSRYRMVVTIEGVAIGKDQTDIIHKFLGISVVRIFGVGVWLKRIGGAKLALNSGDVHGRLDYLEVLGDVKSDRIDGSLEWCGILGLLKRAKNG